MFHFPLLTLYFSTSTFQSVPEPVLSLLWCWTFGPLSRLAQGIATVCSEQWSWPELWMLRSYARLSNRANAMEMHQIDLANVNLDFNLESEIIQRRLPSPRHIKKNHHLLQNFTNDTMPESNAWWKKWNAVSVLLIEGWCIWFDSICSHCALALLCCCSVLHSNQVQFNECPSHSVLPTPGSFCIGEANIHHCSVHQRSFDWQLTSSLPHKFGLHHSLWDSVLAAGVHFIIPFPLSQTYFSITTPCLAWQPELNSQSGFPKDETRQPFSLTPLLTAFGFHVHILSLHLFHTFASDLIFIVKCLFNLSNPIQPFSAGFCPRVVVGPSC